MKIVQNKVNGEVHGVRVERTFTEKFLDKHPDFIDGCKICGICALIGTVIGVIICVI